MGAADTITDFLSGTDKLVLDHVAFNTLGSAGALNAQVFATGAGLVSGQNANNHLIFDATHSDLYYDADGFGAGAAILVAHLTSVTNLKATDILVG